jgi:hypothetical protein
VAPGGRLGLAIIVALLTFSTSGISTLVVLEPCTGYDQTAESDGACPPACVTCGCCAQSVESVIVSIPSSPERLVVDVNPFTSRLPSTRAREILHVPKLRFA